MKKTIKIGIIAIVIVFGTFKILEWVLESKFERLINSKPDRDYNITYEDFALSTFFSGITLNNVSITPFNKTEGTIINGTVDYAELTGFAWSKYLFSKSLEVDGIQFNYPKFNINVVEDTLLKAETKKNNNLTLQALFSDILSRADLSEFQINDGSIIVKEADSLIKGEVHHINLLASGIEIDSLKLTNIIPFKLDNLEVDIDSMSYQINSYTKARLGSLDYRMAERSIKIKDVSLNYEKDWVEISKERGVQDDVIEFDLKAISISGLEYTSSFWTNLDIKAHKMEIDSFSLSMKRNKNLKRPKDEKKALFKGMVDKIPYSIDLDSINISNSKILYGELSKGHQSTGIIEINAINGSITDFSTFPERQIELGAFKADLTARLNDAADMSINMEVPYDKDTFSLHTTLNNMNMAALSPSLVPLLGIEIDQGYLKRFDFRMNASYYGSQNALIMDYDDLHLTVYEQDDDGSQHKKDLFSSLANVAIRHHNLPGERHYLTANYRTERNIYRSPFQHIVAGALDGVKHIVPARGLQSIFNRKGKVKKKRR